MEKLKDINGRVVHVGDKVVLLCKNYGYKKLSSAHLTKTIYLGINQWGHNFKCGYTIKQPECVRI